MTNNVLDGRMYNACCADCGLDVIDAGEWYMVHDQIWQRAWGHIERSAPGSQILCVGCLENRIGRALAPSDFPDVPTNKLDDSRMSYRLLTRLGWC